MTEEEYDVWRDVKVPASVNHPAHYNAGGIECIDAINACMSREAFQGFCKGNCLKYLWRWEHKGKYEDLKKARWYLDRMLAEEAGK